VNQLSGGEQQRITIAGALAANLELYELRFVTMSKHSDFLAMTDYINIILIMGPYVTCYCASSRYTR